MRLSAAVSLLLPFFCADIGASVGESGGVAATGLRSLEGPGFEPVEPYFDLEESANLTALLGNTAVLNCRVKNIGGKTVSWVRHRDIHLLTVGRFTYTSDGRFAARHAPGSEDWLLLIHYLQKRDAGMYGCQVSTTPPRSHSIHLSVVEPETVIVGGPDVYINTGSRLALSCSVKYSPEPPAFIFWYHDDKLVSYDRTRVGVVVSTERGQETTSRLLVHLAEPHHSGVYTCAPANSSPKTVNVHVIAGDQPAAIVHENTSERTVSQRCSWDMLGLLLAHRLLM
ncbi:neuronal growth regulator 1-like [Procambarus clarkii]|uniref:neuronal growth regulator 1-like n=1 Tax=Procambarus clarkii TaxID=6728 RepID=UPI0037420B85